MTTAERGIARDDTDNLYNIALYFDTEMKSASDSSYKDEHSRLLRAAAERVRLQEAQVHYKEGLEGEDQYVKKKLDEVNVDFEPPTELMKEVLWR